ncbi:MAG: M20 family metallopeptidase [Chloroflexia bacterium]|nr:M20 family metallopeptidase [Chloroflexia bacterium]
MIESTLHDYFSARQDEMLAVLEELVLHESPSDDKVLLDLLARRLQQRFAALGVETELLPQETAGDHLRVYQPAPAPGRPPALLLCHYDTVWPAGTLQERPFRIEGGRAWGPGVYDMKAGILLAEFALRAVRDLDLTLPRPVVVLLNSDEEVGSATSRSWIEEQARLAEYVLVLESALPGNVLKTARKGVGHFQIEIEGRAAHSGGEPEKGRSAIQELALQILHLHGLSDLEQGTTVNVGVVRGGTRSNVVAAQAQAEVDVRAWTREEAQRIEAVVRGLQPRTPDVELKVRGGFERWPMERSPAVAELFARVQEIGRALGLDLSEGSSGGGSDGNFCAALGVPTLDGLGVPGDGAHAEHEHILLDALPDRAALLAAALLRL